MSGRVVKEEVMQLVGANEVFCLHGRCCRRSLPVSVPGLSGCRLCRGSAARSWRLSVSSANRSTRYLTNVFGTDEFTPYVEIGRRYKSPIRARVQTDRRCRRHPSGPLAWSVSICVRSRACEFSYVTSRMPGCSVLCRRSVVPPPC